jgi:membrane protein
MRPDLHPTVPRARPNRVAGTALAHCEASCRRWGFDRTDLSPDSRFSPMLRHLSRAARSAASVPRYYGEGLIECAAHRPMFLWAQAIAFKVFVSLLPLILLATGIFGLVLRRSDPFETVASFLRSFLPDGYGASLVELVYSLQAASGAVTVVGAVALFVAVITLFSTLRYVIGAAMGETRHKMRTLLRGYLFDVRMAVQVGSLFLLSFAITFVAGAVRTSKR